MSKDNLQGVADMTALLAQLLHRLEKLEQRADATDEQVALTADHCNKLRYGDNDYSADSTWGVGLSQLHDRLTTLEKKPAPTPEPKTKVRKGWWR